MRVFSKELLMGNRGIYEWTIPGTYTLKLPVAARLRIELVGSGERYRNSGTNGRGQAVYIAGGGGAAWVGQARIPAGTYTIEVGGLIYVPSVSSYGITWPAYYMGGNSKFGTLLTTGGGNMGSGGGVSMDDNFDFIRGTIEVNASGDSAYLDDLMYGTNTPATAYGGESRWKGYGKGADYLVDNETTGYCRIEFM